MTRKVARLTGKTKVEDAVRSCSDAGFKKCRQLPVQFRAEEVHFEWGCDSVNGNLPPTTGITFILREGKLSFPAGRAAGWEVIAAGRARVAKVPSEK